MEINIIPTSELNEDLLSDMILEETAVLPILFLKRLFEIENFE